MLMLATLVGVGSGVIRAYENDNAGEQSEDSALVVAGNNDREGAGQTVADAPGDSADSAADAMIGAPANEPPAEPQPRYAAPAGVTAIAVHGFNPATGELLFAEAADERMPVGSIVKIATALVTVEHAALDEPVLIDQSDLVDVAVYSNMALIPGDTLTVEQLLQGLLIPSGTDGARALARYVGGKLSGSDDPDTARAAFYTEMNAYAARLGLENTRFANAGGEDDAGGYSSAEDVSIMAGELMANPALAAIVGQASYEFTGADGANTYAGANTNALLGQNGVIGVKTGSTGNAGGCVVLARQLADGQVVILTVLGSDIAYNELNQIIADARWDDATLLFSQMTS
jgi:D-alanyl-D-alanine carboxypeptidase (penicillin-binding protein 5/6)